MRAVETYEQAIEYLYRRINYERLSGSAYSTADFKLDRMREFLDRLGNPQHDLPVVHIAGTKGKGSTAAMTASILQQAGYRTGLFTSPHISRFEERMAVNGRIPSPEELISLINEVADVVADLDRRPGQMGPTYFELSTALAWLYFRRERADIVALEVGMGGRLDATNVCEPVVTAITSISRDHTRQLGSTLGEIAREKAGIIKPGTPCVSGATAPAAAAVIAEVCAAQQAPLDLLGREFQYRPAAPRDESSGAPLPETGRADNPRWEIEVGRQKDLHLETPLVGDHQGHNLAVTVAILHRLQERGYQISEQQMQAGLLQLAWPARIEVIGESPTVIVDAAHNWAAVSALVRTLDTRWTARRRILVFAGTQDKDVAGLLRQLLPAFDTVILTAYQSNPRVMPINELCRLVQRFGRTAHVVETPASAWKLATRWAGRDDLICVTGSFFIAAEIREVCLDEQRSELQERSERQEPLSGTVNTTAGVMTLPDTGSQDRQPGA